MHAYTFREHERRVGELARSMGFTHVSLSSEVMPMVKVGLSRRHVCLRTRNARSQLVPRGFTTCADAYLTPCIKQYVEQFEAGFDEARCRRSRVPMPRAC